MVFTDIALNDSASNFGSNSFYLGFSNDTALTADSGATALSGEIGTRVACTVSIINNEVTVSGVRSSAYVVSTATGDVLTGIGLFDSVTGGNIFTVTTLPSILHTINYDLDVDTVVGYTRG